MHGAPTATPICQRQVNIVFSGPHAPDEIVNWIKIFRRDRAMIGDTRGRQANRFRKIEQGGSAHQVRPFACQDAQRLWKEHIIAGCQPDTSAGSIVSWQAKVARACPQAVLRGQVQLAVGAVNAFGIDEQDRVVVGWGWSFYPLGYPKYQAYL